MLACVLLDCCFWYVGGAWLIDVLSFFVVCGQLSVVVCCFVIPVY